jgi:methionyl-tRNA formyltransferase
VAVITLPHERRSAHSDYVDLEPVCRDRDIPVLREANVNDARVIAQVAELKPDYLLVIGWSRLVKAEFRAIAPGGVIGYHPTLLPAMRGRAALGWTIALGLRETGATLFWIDEGVDTGPIAVQRRFPLPDRLYLDQLLALHMAALGPMIAELVQGLASGRCPKIEQDHSRASYLALRRAEDGEIDWRDTAASIERLVRAVSRPYPGAFTYHGGKKLTIWRARLIHDPDWYALTGQVYRYADGLPVVRCGDGQSLVIEDYGIEVDGQAGVEAGAPPARISGQPRFRSPR